jgi:hypothetical protein
MFEGRQDEAVDQIDAGGGVAEQARGLADAVRGTLWAGEQQGDRDDDAGADHREELAIQGARFDPERLTRHDADETGTTVVKGLEECARPPVRPSISPNRAPRKIIQTIFCVEDVRIGDDDTRWGSCDGRSARAPKAIVRSAAPVRRGNASETANSA